MGLFPNISSQYTFGGKSHTNLVISEGAAPAEKFIVSKTNTAEPFHYEYGPEGAQTVAIAKGKIVEAVAPEYDRETGRMVTAIRQATEGSKSAIGVNHHNVYKKRRDGMNGGDATVITRSYIEVPLFEHATVDTAKGAAKAMRFGAAYGQTNVIKPGDFVKVGADGNFEKLDVANDSPFQIVGQALAVERELPPAGFLQYYMEQMNPELEAMLKAMSVTPSPGLNGKDAGAYPYGIPYTNKGWKPEFEEMLIGKGFNKGIPFLTDGFFRAQEKRVIALNDKYDAATKAGNIEAVRPTESVTITDDDITVAAESRNAAVFIKLHHPINKVKSTPVVVKYMTADATPVAKTVAGEDLHIDYTNNTVVIYLEAGAVLKDVKIEAELVVDPVAGIPTEWDYAGSVGAVRILLQR